jgi:hypothetical protein
VKFQCGYCGNLMDVEEQLLGQPVRCPHCQQVVQTQAPLPSAIPSPPGEAPSAITFTEPEAKEEGSIFEVSEHAGDALFGNVEATRIEMPLDMPAVQPPSETPSETTIFSPPPPSVDAILGSAEHPRLEMRSEQPQVQSLPDLPLTENIAHPQPVPQSPGGAAADASATWTTFAPQAPASDVRTSELLLPSATDSSDLATNAFPTNLPRRALPSGMGSGLFIALVVIPLISYAVLATIAVLILYLRPPQPSLEYLPDVDGDFHGAKHQKRGHISYPRLDPDSPLPERLKVALGHSIQLGDVEVTPQKVELTRLKIRHPDLSVDPMPTESLVLHLAFRNISQDVVFHPTDPYFERRWKSAQDPKPYTFLEIDARRLYGGPLPWSGMRRDARPALEGQAHQMLQPGEQVSTFVATDPDEPVDKLVMNHRGDLLWRVQVRRGLVRVGEREVPATAVIGVQFHAADIEKPQM